MRKERELKKSALAFWNAAAPALLFWLLQIIVGNVLIVIMDFIRENAGSELYTSLGTYVLQHSGDVQAYLTAISYCIAFCFVLGESGRELRAFSEWKLIRKQQNILNKKAVPKHRWKSDPKLQAAILFVIGIVASILINLLFSALGWITKGAAGTQSAQVSIGCGIAVYGILTPFIEESVFRGTTFGRLRREGLLSYSERGNLIASVLLSAVLFGLFHMNILQFVYATVMGCIFALLYDKTEKTGILTPIILHGLCNIVMLYLAR